MITTVELENELTTIEQQLDTLSKKRFELQQTIKSVKENNWRQTISDWGLNAETYLVMFNKNTYDFYSILIMHSLTIDTELMNVCCTTGNYSNLNDELCYRVTQDNWHFSRLIEYSDKYSIYILDKEQFSLIQQYLCDLKIDSHNINDYEQVLATHAIRRIS